MKFFQVVLFILCCLACSYSFEDRSSSNRAIVVNHNSEALLRHLSDSDSLAWITVKQVIDTVSYYRQCAEEWPESAVAALIEPFWEKQIRYPELRFRLKDPMNTFHRDTMRLNRFVTFLSEGDYSSSERIYFGDFKHILYKYLNKKYNRLLEKVIYQIPLYQQEIHVKDSVIWETLFESVVTVVDSIFIGPDVYLFREIDKQHILEKINKQRLHMLAEMYLVLAAPEYKVPKITFNKLSFEDVTWLYHEIMRQNIPSPNQLWAIMINQRLWEQWYKRRREFHPYIIWYNQKYQFEQHLQYLLQVRYHFLNQVKQKMIRYEACS